MVDALLAMSFGHALWLILQGIIGIGLLCLTFAFWGVWFFEQLLSSGRNKDAWSIVALRWLVLIACAVFLRGCPFPALL